MKRALLTGITGQDGSYLAELLIAKSYEVHGVVRRSSSFNTERIDHLYRDPHEPGVQLFLHYGDLNDGSSMQSIIADVHPDEIYNLGAQSHVRVSFDIPEYTGEVTGLGTIRVLEAVRKLGAACRVYVAGSSELFGGIGNAPQSETTPFHPRSPYGAAKAYAFHVTQNYREAYGLFAVNGILFNHESERRGETHSVTEFLELAFGHAGLDWHDFVRQDPRYFRPSEVDVLCADPSKARRELGWRPRVTFPELVRRMVDSDLALAAREKRAQGV